MKTVSAKRVGRRRRRRRVQTRTTRLTLPPLQARDNSLHQPPTQPASLCRSRASLRFFFFCQVPRERAALLPFFFPPRHQVQQTKKTLEGRVTTTLVVASCTTTTALHIPSCSILGMSFITRTKTPQTLQGKRKLKQGTATRPGAAAQDQCSRRTSSGQRRKSADPKTTAEAESTTNKHQQTRNKRLSVSRRERGQ